MSNCEGNCEDCGNEIPVSWMASPALWSELSGGKNLLCPSCFDIRAAQRGLFLLWSPIVRSPLERAQPLPWQMTLQLAEAAARYSGAESPEGVLAQEIADLRSSLLEWQLRAEQE